MFRLTNLAAMTMTLLWLLTCGLAVSAQSLEVELKEVAPKKWLELRKLAFNELAINVATSMRITTRSKKDDGAETRKIRTSQTFFADGEFRYFEMVPLEDTTSKNVPFNRSHVQALNSNYAFFVRQNEDMNWVVETVERTPTNFEFDEEILDVNWLNRNQKGPLNELKSAFSQDPRWLIGRGRLFDNYINSLLAMEEPVLDGLTERIDPNFGRIVSAKIAIDADWKDRPRANRQPTKAVKVELRGKVELLADWYWAPLKLETNHRQLDKDGGEVSSSRLTFDAVYDPGQIQTDVKPNQLIPSKVMIESESAGSKVEIIHTIKQLSGNEIATIKKSCKLSGFGLDEPDK